MKILLDACVWGGALKELSALGHDVIWAGDWSEDPGDDEILKRAFQEGRLLVTLDKDFGEKAIVKKMPHCGILRLVKISAKKQAKICHEVVLLHGKELKESAIVTVEPGRLRIRPPD